jgi:hemerythrin
MTHWDWDPSLSVGIEEIDKQHKQLITHINELKIAFSYNKMYMIEEVLENLINYTNSHFKFEEKLMEEANYPYLEEHKKSHIAFEKRIKFFKERYENGENISKQLRSDLQLWLMHHIKEDDADYKEIVKTSLEK